MQVKLKEAVSFKPITLELIIESEEELLDLWSRLCIDDDPINEYHEQYKATEDDCNDLFDALDQYKNQFGL